MKKILYLLPVILCLTGCSLLQNVNWDSAQLQNAAGNALTAITLTDAQIIELSRQTIAQEDAKHKIDNGSYATRLKKVLAGARVDGLTLDPKVYILNEVNAFACGDGSIRVYSGLMDIMTDDELLAVVGHEIGHVVNHDTRDAMKNAYLAAAARGLVNAAGSIGALSQSVIGDIGEAYFNSQYSQKQEYAADKFGFQFTVANGHDPYGMYNSLVKLMQLSGGESNASSLEKMFSSHPETAERAKRVKEMADKIK